MTAMTVPEPTRCGTCGGDELISIGGPDTVPCPECCCQICGKPTTMPPECLDCAADEESKAKRREDRA